MMKNRKKTVISLAIFFLFALVFASVVSGSESKKTPYHSGDAVSYGGKVIFASANSGDLELFVLDNGKKIIKTAVLESLSNKYFGTDKFYDLTFNVEGGELFLYSVDGRFFYKYNVSNPYFPKLVNKIQDNTWYYYGIDKFGDRIATIGTKGVKIWNADLQVINAFDIRNDYFYNVSFDFEQNFVFDINKNKLKISDYYLRNLISEIPLFTNEYHNRGIYTDKVSKEIYVVDDEALKVFNNSGKMINKFKHISNLGYDVVGLDNSPYVYFSDGLGIVKMDKKRFKPVDWIYTTSAQMGNGWVMGLKIVSDAKGEKIIAFNHTGILVLDDNLDLIDRYKAEEAEDEKRENLWLSLDKNIAKAGTLVLLTGGGYGAGENLTISFAKEILKIRVDAQGRFANMIEVPSILPVRTDIKVVGDASGLSYSIGFEIL